MQNLYAELCDMTERLMGELATCKSSGCQLAQNEAAYRKELRKAILDERERGTPVTIISDICRGRDDIADLKRSRDCSEAIYRASQEAINVYKLRIRLLDAQMQREWTSGGIGG